MEVMLLHNSLKTHTDLTIPFSNGVTLHLPDGFGGPKCVCGWVKFPKYTCLVAQLGQQLLEKQILKIILDILG